MDIAELIQQKIQNLGKKEKQLNERQTLIKELYEVYALENKYENYYRYLRWLGKRPKTKENATEFTKVKLPIEKKYIKPFTSSYFAIRLSHIPTKDLYYLTSIERDSVNRKGYSRSSFTKWLFSSLKCK